VIKAIGRGIDSLVDKLVAALLAIALIQLPHYMESYALFLSGYLLAMEEEISDFKENADKFGVTLEEYIVRHEKAADQMIRATGQTIRSHMEKRDRVRDALHRWELAKTWQKPFVFIQIVDMELTRKMHYKPGFSFTLESLAYAGSGVLAGFLLYTILIRSFLGWIWRRIFPPKAKIA